jgi:hypothetical protein
MGQYVVETENGFQRWQSAVAMETAPLLLVAVNQSADGN